MKDNKDLRAKAASLESRVDFLETEIGRLNEMLIQFGFDNGIRTLVETLDEAMEIEKLFRERN